MIRLFLIDGHNFAYRAFFAVKFLSTSNGIPTNAVYGFTNMLLKLLKEEKPDYLLVVFDSPTLTFRHQIYKEYKAHRQKMPEDMRHQISLIQEVVKAFNIPVISKDGYEADDLLATISNQFEEKINNVDEIVIVTGDKDALQLVTSKTKVLSTNTLYNIDEVKKRFGVEPSQVIDVLALAGDTSDNIPGVSGIGEKKAVALVQKFGSVEQIYNQIDKISNERLQKQLETDKEKAFLSKNLVILNRQVPIDNIDLIACKTNNWEGNTNNKTLLNLLTELEFHKIIGELGLIKTDTLPETPPLTKDYKIVIGQNELLELVRELEQTKACSIKLERCSTSGTQKDLMPLAIIGIALAYEENSITKTYYIPLNPDVTSLVLETLKPILESELIKKYGHDIKHQLKVLSHYGIKLNGLAFDTMLASYLLKPEGKHTIETLALKYLGIKKNVFDKEAASDSNVISNHACVDVDIILQLVKVLAPILKNKGLFALFEQIEMPLIEILAQMEQNGICVDTYYLKQLSMQFGQRLKELDNEIYLLAGTEFNINSPKQLGFILFEKLQMPVIKKTKRGSTSGKNNTSIRGYSTDEDVLNRLTVYHQLPYKILEHRELNKLKSTYLDALTQLANPKTKRVHTSYNQAVTTTGRLSSSEPNLQNIPIKTDLGRLVRQAFVPQDGYLLLSADYSQIELRILAHLSQDPKLIEAFLMDEDIHTLTACELFKVSFPSMIDNEMRRMAKVVNFGITYGMSPYGLSKELKITQKAAKEIIERYFERYKMVKEYIEKTIQEAKENGYVSTLFGRRRYLSDINSSNKNLREFAQRQAVNMPIQGSCADIIKLAMLNIHQKLNRLPTQTARMLLNVHDELVFEVLEEQTEEIIQIVKQGMENVVNLCVPLKVDIKISSNWSK